MLVAASKQVERERSIGGQPWKPFLPTHSSCYSATEAGHRSLVLVPVMTQDVQELYSIISFANGKFYPNYNRI